MYSEEMGKVVPAKYRLRAWGSNKKLDMKGMVRATISTKRGAATRSWIYVVGGHNPEPLLGDKDAAALGIITFNPEGRDPTPEEEEEHKTNKVRKLVERSMPEKLRSSGFRVETRKGPVECIKQSDKTAAMAIVKRFHNTVFLPGIGCIKTEPVKFAFDKDFKPIQPP